MLIVALVLAVIGLAALVTAVVTSNEVVAWVCIGASALGVVLLVVDAIRERQQRRVGALGGATAVAETLPAATEAGDETGGGEAGDETTELLPRPGDGQVSEQQAEITDEADTVLQDEADTVLQDEADTVLQDEAAEDYPDEIVHDEPEYDTYSDDEPEFPEPAEESALHVVADPDESVAPEDR